ncbi:multicomponent Na+:H+ antiporter subunit E [Leucobacter exalbidus]|uniref:Multicomponent Na+:H+ antiporter subunit E n=1 Tax=Leucobacter exalbidus TaxID=662960 RepID=A0A940PUP7_9MICO|nr:Na+/H+ antiporter subunit E [Leucobacter exalbidus]MBP1325581.1 multicomponent Na+:H+ antiporter subunit E [Leucobacter exalbidus]
MSKLSRASARRMEWAVRVHELPLMVGLVALWALMWGELSLLSVVSGIVVAIVVMRLFYLPPVELAGRFNLWYGLKFLGYFLWHLAKASWQVAWIAVRPGPPPPVAIIGARLHTKSDFILTAVALTISLIPGSFVADVDRFESVLYLHVLNTPSQREITAMRREVRRIERLLVLTFGNPGPQADSERQDTDQ